MRETYLKIFFVVAGIAFAAFSAMIALSWLAGHLRHLSEADWTLRIFGVIVFSIALGIAAVLAFRTPPSKGTEG